MVDGRRAGGGRRGGPGGLCRSHAQPGLAVMPGKFAQRQPGFLAFDDGEVIRGWHGLQRHRAGPGGHEPFRAFMGHDFIGLGQQHLGALHDLLAVRDRIEMVAHQLAQRHQREALAHQFKQRVVGRDQLQALEVLQVRQLDRDAGAQAAPHHMHAGVGEDTPRMQQELAGVGHCGTLGREAVGVSQAAVVVGGEGHAGGQPARVLQRFEHILATPGQVEQQVAHVVAGGMVDVAAHHAAGDQVRVANDAVGQVARRAPARIEQQPLLVERQVGPVAGEAAGSHQRGCQRTAGDQWHG
ncbi:hypothetical protein D9M72_337310 [compost metagenome]